MNKNFRIALLIASSVLLTFTSCEEILIDDPFADPVEKFLGNWESTETVDPPDGLWIYDVVISRNPQNSTEILISNFNLQGSRERARAMVTGNRLIIPTQLICDNTIRIEGSGTYSNGEITLSYTTNDGADLKRFNAVYKRH